jgi:hypothetical protein
MLRRTRRFSSSLLERQTSLGPILLPPGVLFHVAVTHRHQLTGGVLCGVSGRAGTVDHDICGLVRKALRREVPHLNRREVDRPRDVAIAKGWRWQGLDQGEFISAVEPGLELVAAYEWQCAVSMDPVLGRNAHCASRSPNLLNIRLEKPCPRV